MKHLYTIKDLLKDVRSEIRGCYDNYVLQYYVCFNNMFFVSIKFTKKSILSLYITCDDETVNGHSIYDATQKEMLTEIERLVNYGIEYFGGTQS